MEISIIVPIYNVKEYLSQCLDSILRQTYQNFELLLVNDGSTDGSKEIAEIYAQKYPDKIRLFHQKNQGLSAARNCGLEKARGKYVVFVDSDDTISERMAEELYNRAESLDSDLVMCAFHSVDEQGNEIRQIHETCIEKDKISCLEENKKILLCQNAAWNKLYRRSVIEQYGLRFTPGVWYEDIRFTKKFMLHAKNIVYCDEILYDYLVRPGSIMNSMGDERNVQILDAIREVADYYKEKGLDESYKAEIEFLAIDHIYITTLVRVIRGENRKLLHHIDKEFKEMFPNYKDNKYISTLDTRRKMIFKLLNMKMYFMIGILFKLKK